MIILFDHGTPRGLARALPGHAIVTAKAKGRDRLVNEVLSLAAARKWMYRSSKGTATRRVKIPERLKSRVCGFAAAWLALLVAGLVTPGPVSAQSSSNPGIAIGSIDRGYLVGAIMGIAAVAGLGITFLALHNRGVVVGAAPGSLRRGGNSLRITPPHVSYSGIIVAPVGIRLISCHW